MSPVDAEADQPQIHSVESPVYAWLLLAHILRPQGRKGEVLAELLTDFPERFDKRADVFLAPPGFSGPPAHARPATILGFFLPVGKNSGRIVLTIEAVESISQAETLTGLDVIVPAEGRLEAGEDASYISDLIGCTVYDVPRGPSKPEAPEDIFIGTVADVHFPTTPDGTRRLEDSAPLLSVLSPEGGEILIPYVKVYLVSQDLRARRILMSLPPGLVDLNN